MQSSHSVHIYVSLLNERMQVFLLRSYELAVLYTQRLQEYDSVCIFVVLVVTSDTSSLIMLSGSSDSGCFFLKKIQIGNMWMTVVNKYNIHTSIIMSWMCRDMVTQNGPYYVFVSLLVKLNDHINNHILSFFKRGNVRIYKFDHIKSGVVSDCTCLKS